MARASGLWKNVLISPTTDGCYIDGLMENVDKFEETSFRRGRGARAYDFRVCRSPLGVLRRLSEFDFDVYSIMAEGTLRETYVVGSCIRFVFVLYSPY